LQSSLLDYAQSSLYLATASQWHIGSLHWEGCGKQSGCCIQSNKHCTFIAFSVSHRGRRVGWC